MFKNVSSVFFLKKKKKILPFLFYFRGIAFSIVSTYYRKSCFYFVFLPFLHAGGVGSSPLPSESPRPGAADEGSTLEMWKFGEMNPSWAELSVFSALK